MKLLVTGDIHYALKQYDWLLSVAPEYDAIVIAGDLLEVASIVQPDAQIVVVRKYLAQLAEHCRVVVCSGNHDLNAESASGERIADWFDSLTALQIVSDGMHTRVQDTMISVFPWWDGPEAKARIADQLEAEAPAPDDFWLWVYHAPPQDSPTSWGGRRHFGDPALTQWIAQYQPALVLSGHVHQAPFVPGGSWADRIGPTWVFNMGQQPGDIPSHIIVDTAQRKALWNSIAGAEELDLSDGSEPQPLHAAPEWLTA